MVFTKQAASVSRLNLVRPLCLMGRRKDITMTLRMVVGMLVFVLLHIGCDGVVGSPRVLDACGVCGGRNSSCQIVSGIFTEPRLKQGYSLVVQIPAGACSVSIEELAATKNYLALRDISGKFIINGEWNIDNSGKYRGAGTVFTYLRQSTEKTTNTGDRVTATGPTSQPVDIVILYQEINRGIKYEYAISRNDSLNSVLPRLPHDLGLRPAQAPRPPSTARRPPGAARRPPGAARRPPGAARRPPGAARRLPSAAQRPLSAARRPPADQQSPAAASLLPPSDQGGSSFVSPLYQPARPPGHLVSPPSRQPPPPPVPPSGGKPVRTRPNGGTRAAGRRRRRRRRRHRFQWVVSGYSKCSVTCGGGTQTAAVVCVRRKRKTVAPDRRCQLRRRPKHAPRICNNIACPPSWQANAWSACSNSCGPGHQKRTFLCVRAGRPVDSSECVGRPTEPDTRPCQLARCPPPAVWNIGPWSQCSVSCGWGTRTRQVSCAEGTLSGWCPEPDRPRDSAPCRRQPCPPGRQTGRSAADGWMVTQWTRQCSVECGRGLQSRGITCGAGSGNCDVTQRPQQTRPCKTDRGCAGVWFTGPWSQCSPECGGGGMTTRPVACLAYSAGEFRVTADSACSPPTPDSEQPCGGGGGGGGGCPPRWFVSDWSSCSSTCGAGWQRRTVACVDAAGRRAADCPPAAAPADQRACTMPECPSHGNSYHMRVEWSQSPEPELRLLPG